MSKEIIVNGETYLKKDTSGLKKMIVIVDNRGLTFIGNVDLSGNEEQITIYNAQCVVRWGTSQHLAEIAENGVTESTKLGLKKDVIVFRRQIVAAYLCDE